MKEESSHATETGGSQKDMTDLLKINFEIGWNCDFRCEDCYRFFDCPSPHRHTLYKSARMEQIKKNLSQIRRIVAVLSSKGGVGKSTISANLSMGLAQRGNRVAILDSDFSGSSIPYILGVAKAKLHSAPDGIVPPEGPLGIKIVSTAFFLDHGRPITWFSDLKTAALELFLANVAYGPLDYLVVDLPPGTGSETVNLLKFLPQIAGAVIVTIPSELSEDVVRRCLTVCRKARIPILGIIENMSSFLCPKCGAVYTPGHSAGETLAAQTGVRLLGTVPHDPVIIKASDQGKSFLTEYPAAGATKSFAAIVEAIDTSLTTKGQGRLSPKANKAGEHYPEILKINVDDSCYGKNCGNCDRYFSCTNDLKREFSRGAIDKNLAARMADIKHKVAVMSGKGGVGKSTFAGNLAAALAQQGKKTAIVDCDLHGPCIPRILGVEGKGLKITSKGIVPVSGFANVQVVSMAFLLETDEAVTWFDSLKRTTVEEFLSYVDYGKLDYLVVDLPPGTGAESFGVLQYIPGLDGIVIVTIPAIGPQEVVSRSVTLCRQANVPIIGVVENMDGFVCPACETVSAFDGKNGGKELARELGIEFLGKIPLDYRISESCDKGVPFIAACPESDASRCFDAIARRIRQQLEPPPA